MKDLDKHTIFHHWTRVYVGAANSPPDLVKRVESSDSGCRYINAFGMVEGPCSQSRPNAPFEVRTETIGLPVCPLRRFLHSWTN